MQKFFASLIAAFMMTAGLVAFTSSSATAACDAYTGCVDTFTRIGGADNVKRHRRANFYVQVTTAGNGAPVGRVTISVKRTTGGYSFLDSKRYTGGKVFFTTTKLHKLGKYIVRAKFDRKAGSAYEDSNNVETFRVVR